MIFKDCPRYSVGDCRAYARADHGSETSSDDARRPDALDRDEAHPDARADADSAQGDTARHAAHTNQYVRVFVHPVAGSVPRVGESVAAIHIQQFFLIEFRPVDVLIHVLHGLYPHFRSFVFVCPGPIALTPIYTTCRAEWLLFFEKMNIFRQTYFGPSGRVI